ncbi:putative regulatory protein, FmdB family [Streptococcus gallolyticus]|uniref:Putative regulatory protein, FmdB family n=1 Tax=Streptococcus gallolyticus TaxID=315405 RepID=A0A380JZA6_9STRE|nr:putative regulatory protein, FmdB family [Streptococcus gallolyticus]
MYTYEYHCSDCGERWEIIDSYPPLECPHCESEEIYQTWKQERMTDTIILTKERDKINAIHLSGTQHQIIQLLVMNS